MERININDAKFAFLNSNREVSNNANLEKQIRERGVLIPILVVKGSEVMEERLFAVGKDGKKQAELQENEKKDCLVVLDGQHRLTTLLRILNDKKGKHSDKCTEQIPIIEYSKSEIGDNVSQFVIALNSTSKTWSNRDYIDNAYTINPEDGLLKAIFAFQKKDCAISTISRYLFLNNKSLDKNSLERYVYYGEKIKNGNWEQGIRIYCTLQKKGFSKKLLNSRYLIDYVIERSKGCSIDTAIHKLYHLEKETVDKLNALKGSERNDKTLETLIDKGYSLRLEHAKNEEERTGIKTVKNYLEKMSEDDIREFLKTKDSTPQKDVEQTGMTTEASTKVESSTETRTAKKVIENKQDAVVVSDIKLNDTEVVSINANKS